MTALAIVALALAAVLLLVAVLVLLTALRPHEREVLAAWAADLERHSATILRFAEQAQERDERLLTALLSVQNPNAAVLFGRHDEMRARAQTADVRATTFRDFLDETKDERDTEYSADGSPIIPVGMGG